MITAFLFYVIASQQSPSVVNSDIAIKNASAEIERLWPGRKPKCTGSRLSFGKTGAYYYVEFYPLSVEVHATTGNLYYLEDNSADDLVEGEEGKLKVRELDGKSFLRKQASRLFPGKDNTLSYFWYREVGGGRIELSAAFQREKFDYPLLMPLVSFARFNARTGNLISIVYGADYRVEKSSVKIEKAQAQQLARKYIQEDPIHKRYKMDFSKTPITKTTLGYAGAGVPFRFCSTSFMDPNFVWPFKLCYEVKFKTGDRVWVSAADGTSHGGEPVVLQ